jgi:phosphodiesterase/alkaline phosphatase D-like protein
VNSNGSTGNASFIWGTDPSNLSNQTPIVPIATLLSKQSVGAVLNGLTANTTYFYQLSFQNTSNGQSGAGGIESFFTGPPAP